MQTTLRKDYESELEKFRKTFPSHKHNNPTSWVDIAQIQQFIDDFEAQAVNETTEFTLGLTAPMWFGRCIDRFRGSPSPMTDPKNNRARREIRAREKMSPPTRKFLLV